MAKNYALPQNKEALMQGGLTPGQASIYEALVQYGPQNARRASFLSGVSRTLGYKILEDLERLGLVVKIDAPKSVAKFSAAHPLKLKELAEKRFDEARDAKVALDGALSKLVSDFNKVSGQPGIRIAEGPQGIAELLEDQLNERQPIFIIRSPKYVDFKELSGIFTSHLDERAKLRIPVKSIESYNEETFKRLDIDKKAGIERHFVSEEFISIPADVVIYGNKVALNAYERPLMTTIIENTAIHMTFSILFDYLWKLTESEHQKFLKKGWL